MLLLFLPLMLFSGSRPITLFKRVKMQPSEVCPKNFIIFDQTDNQSRIMFHPVMANKFSGPGLNVHATYNRDPEKNKANPVEGELFSPFEEDSKDIGGLLSLEGEEVEDHDKEELSTTRTNESYESTCDTCSSYGSKSNKRSSSSVRKSHKTHGHCSNPEIKQWEVKRMIRVLRGIVPGGGDQMDSVTVLDEAAPVSHSEARQHFSPSVRTLQLIGKEEVRNMEAGQRYLTVEGKNLNHKMPHFLFLCFPPEPLSFFKPRGIHKSQPASEEPRHACLFGLMVETVFLT